jgi:hypothetical protein
MSEEEWKKMKRKEENFEMEIYVDFILAFSRVLFFMIFFGFATN